MSTRWIPGAARPISISIVAVALIVIFKLPPAGAAAVGSLFDVRLPSLVGRFVAFANYLELLRDAGFRHALGVSASYCAGVTTGTLALGVALAGATRDPGLWSSAIRVGFLLPALMPGVAAAAVWRWLYDPYFGLFDRRATGSRVAGPGWL